jgi:ADP-heptose:LPS heptosyltransferase
LGDEIMLSGTARKAQETDPRKCVPTYEGRPKWNQWGAQIWANNPRIAQPGERGDFQTLIARDSNNMRPYHLAKTPERWTYNLAFRPDVGELYFTDEEKRFAEKYRDRVIIEPHIKPGASPNKQWGWMRWNKVAWLAQKEGIKVTQLGPPGLQLLEGAEHVVTPSFRLAAAVLAVSRAAVLPEGGAHHAAAAVGLPAVVIFGGYIPVELTGYPGHINIGASLADACGNRQPCQHCADWMKRITPEDVFDHLMAILKK